MDKISEKKILDKIKQLLEYLYDINELEYFLEEGIYDICIDMYNDLSGKYLIPVSKENLIKTLEENNDIEQEQDPYGPFSKDSEVIKIMMPIEWFGEDLGFSIKDNEYFLLTGVEEEEEDIKCYYIDKIASNDLEMSRKLASIFEILDGVGNLRVID